MPAARPGRDGVNEGVTANLLMAIAMVSMPRDVTVHEPRRIDVPRRRRPRPTRAGTEIDMAKRHSNLVIFREYVSKMHVFLRIICRKFDNLSSVAHNMRERVFRGV